MGVPQQDPAAPAVRPTRLESVDAYRGLVMFLMMAEVLRLSATAKAVHASEKLAGVEPGTFGSGVWDFLAHHQTHVQWVGCSLHDLIQPSFSFLVGVSLPFSLAARAARGQSKLWMVLHAFWRAFLLIAIGTVLRSFNKEIPDYGFIDTLCQIGMGYGFLFLLGFRPVRDQWIAFAAILVGYWALFALWPLPGPDFDWAAVGVKPEWLSQHGLTGFAAHWNRGANPGAAFDQWFLNLFPREKPFTAHGGGYNTLNFVPTLATMILGLIAGGVLKGDRSRWGKVLWLAAAGLIGLGAGYGLGAAGVCPVVKVIWTPSWVLFSGGWCLVLLAGFYAVVDVGGWRKWAFPLVVIGVNSIAAYCLASAFVKPEVHKMVLRHFGGRTISMFGMEFTPFGVFGPDYVSLLNGAATLAVLWLILLWMYRRKLFLKV